MGLMLIRISFPKESANGFLLKRAKFVEKWKAALPDDPLAEHSLVLYFLRPMRACSSAEETYEAGNTREHRSISRKLHAESTCTRQQGVHVWTACSRPTHAHVTHTANTTHTLTHTQTERTITEGPKQNTHEAAHRASEHQLRTNRNTEEKVPIEDPHGHTVHDQKSQPTP